MNLPEESPLMYDEVGVMKDGTFQKGDWRKIAVHTESEISGFFGPYRWMSNFELTPVEFQGVIYPSSENAYQAAKVHRNSRDAFRHCSPAESKRLWKKIGTPYDKKAWDEIKVEVMRKVVFDKFLRNEELRRKLAETGGAYIEERLWWRDTFWGFDVNLNEGKNMLGHILMQTRAYWDYEYAL